MTTYKDRNKGGKTANVFFDSLVLFVFAMAVILGLEYARFGCFCEFDFGALITGLAFAATITMFYSQSMIMIQQQIENTFFLMLGQWRDITKNIEFGQNWFRGRSVFKDLYNRLEWEYQKKSKYVKEKDNRKIIAGKVLEEFKSKDNEEFQLLENYLHTFCQLLKYIDQKSRFLVPSVKIEEFKSEIIAQLSTYELKLILLLYFTDNLVEGVKKTENEVVKKEEKVKIRKLIFKYSILQQCIKEIDDAQELERPPLVYYAKIEYKEYERNYEQ